MFFPKRIINFANLFYSKKLAKKKLSHQHIVMVFFGRRDCHLSHKEYKVEWIHIKYSYLSILLDYCHVNMNTL